MVYDFFLSNLFYAKAGTLENAQIVGWKAFLNLCYVIILVMKYKFVHINNK